MGGRGASSGNPYWWKGKLRQYRTEYQKVFQTGNIMFVKAVEGASLTPLETQSDRRIYVTLGGKPQRPKYISFYQDGLKTKTLELFGKSHIIDGKPTYPPHAHIGYLHDEGGTREPRPAELHVINLVLRAWQRRNK